MRNLESHRAAENSNWKNTCQFKKQKQTVNFNGLKKTHVKFSSFPPPSPPLLPPKGGSYPQVGVEIFNLLSPSTFSTPPPPTVAPILKIRNLRKPENLERRTQVYRRHTGKCLSGKWGHRRHGEENQKQKSRPAVLSKIPIFDALEQSSRVAPMSPYRREIRFSMLILFGIAEGKCDLPTVCVFFGATFDHHFGTFWTPPKNVRDAEGLKIETIFLIKKHLFFASVFKANPEWYGVFAEAPLEFPEALVWSIFLIIPESTPRWGQLERDGVQQNFKILSPIFLNNFDDSPTLRHFFSSVRPLWLFTVPSIKKCFQEKNGRTFDNCLRTEFCK